MKYILILIYLIFSYSVLSIDRNKKETVNKALKEFIQKRKQEEVLKLFDTINYDPSYDYKQLRNKL